MSRYRIWLAGGVTLAALLPLHAAVPAPDEGAGIAAPASPNVAEGQTGTEATPLPGEPGEPGEGVTASPGPANPYEAIVIRNSFDLRDPPPPPPPPQEASPPVNTTALKLTGITTLLGKRAMFVFNDGKTNKVSDLVREGERDRVITDLEVLEINAAARTVRVVFGGKEMTMDFVKDGLMPPTNQLALAAGGVPPRPGTQVAMANAMPRAPGTLPQPGVQVVNASGLGGTRTLPVRPSRLAAGITPNRGTSTAVVLGSGAGEPAPTLSPDQQNQLIREQVNFGQQINLDMPPLPPAPGLEDLSHPPTFPNLPGEMPAFPVVPGPQ
jgi:hypothetical protein